MFVVSGSENTNALWKESHTHNKAYKALSVHNMFGMPKHTLKFWLSDDSGIGLSPHPDSKVPAHLRIDYLTYSSVTKFLTGPGLRPFVRRFTGNLTNQLQTTDAINYEWTDFSDLSSFVQAEFLTAVIKALFGTYFLQINPNFVLEFWDFHNHVNLLAKGYPRWLFPQPYRLRDKCLESMKKWHIFIKDHLDDEITGPGHWNPYYGADLVKFRHDAWSKMPSMDTDAKATEDVGMIWA